MSQSASSSFTSTYALTKGAPVGILGIGIGGGCGLPLERGNPLKNLNKAHQSEMIYF